jgi:hypothetical protein
MEDAPVRYTKPTDEEIRARLEQLAEWYAQAEDDDDRQRIGAQHRALQWVLGLAKHPGPVL